MRVHILGLGPITSALARELEKDYEVKIYSNHRLDKFDNEVFPYETLLETSLSSTDIFFIGWKDLADDDLIRRKVLGYLKTQLTPQNTVFNLSTVAIYGNSLYPSNELAIPSPINAYGLVKLGLESLYDSLFESKICHLRISNVFGDSMLNDVINRFILAVLNGKAIEIWGELTVSRDFISLQTVIKKISSCVQNLETLESRSVVNISSGQSITLQDVLEMIQEILGRPMQYEVLKNKDVVIEFSTIATDKFDRLFNQVQVDELNELFTYLSSALRPLSENHD